MIRTVGSLCSGIGGFENGLERVGDFQVRWQVEINPFCIEVLEKHWPTVTRYQDVTTLTGDELEPVDLICAGFPCQPVSYASATRKGQNSEKWIWPDIARLVGRVRPKVVLLENTPGLLTAGEPPGSAFAEVLGDLASHGYDAEWSYISCRDLGAPHLRVRIFIYASDSNHKSQSGVLVDDGSRASLSEFANAHQRWKNPLTSLNRVDDGISGRVDRLNRLTSLGNSVCPYIIEWIGRRIRAADDK